MAALLIAGFALAPPLLSADVFSYIDYARLGAAHGLNPYTHAPTALPADAAFPYVGWTDSPSAYGPLFTLLTYPLALLSVPVALWALKGATAASVLVLAALVARLAPARGIDPRRGFVMVALNPLVLVHVVGGAHNDATMVLLLTAGCGGVLVLREAGGGAGLASAVALKLSALFAFPFALLAAARRGRLLIGVAATLAAVSVAALAAFGPHALDSVSVAGENQGRVSSFSIPNLLSEALNVDIDAVRIAALIAFLALVVLLLASAWLLPWYVLWALPFAALSRDERLVAAVFALTALQLAARIPL